MGDDELLGIEDLRVSYRGAGAVDALRGVSIRILSGENIGVLGESGSGKTTLGLAVLGLLGARTRVSGSIRFRGREMVKAAESEWRRVRGAGISAVFQEPRASLNPVLRIESQIGEVVRAHSRATRLNRGAEVDRLMGLAGLADRERLRRAWPHQLSGGECQRVAIAEALACHPALLIADEPTASLDSVSQLHVLETLRTLARGGVCSLLLISHDPAILATIVDTVFVLRAGQVVERGPAEQVLRFPANAYTRSLVQRAG